MLRLRSKEGIVTEIQDLQFVEICDQDGGVARVLYQDANGIIRGFQSGEPDADRYAKLFNVNFTPIVNLRR